MTGDPTGHPTGTIGYYVHHVGSGHRQRARSLAAHLAARGGPAVTGLSSLSRPDGWPGEWVDLPRDDGGGDARGTTAGGRLHWAPLGHRGVRSRTAAISAWIERVGPAVMVVDVSVEVLVLTRLHGVAVIGVMLPGRRDDPAHLLGLDVADALVAFWPAVAHGMLRGLPATLTERVECLGALSRFPPGEADARPRGRAALMLGRGGHDLPPTTVRRLRDGTSRRAWTVLDGGGDDPRLVLLGADVVVSHAGQNAVAEVAAARRPMVVVPQDRPHDEQRTTAAVLDGGGWPVVVLDAWPTLTQEWDDVADRAASLDGSRWAAWCDGRAVERLAAVVDRFRG